MSRLTPEIEQRIEDYHQDGYITLAEAKLITAYFIHVDFKATAKAHGIMKKSVTAVLAKLKRDGVLIKVDEGYELTFDYGTIKREPTPLPTAADMGLEMSKEERAWMLKNYHEYKNKRSEAARILKRSKYDVCRMAIVLKLDQRN